MSHAITIINNMTSESCNNTCVCSDTNELKNLQDVEGGSVLLMFPKQYYRMYDGRIDNAYGACTYLQVVEQTPDGVAKFYSCLYYMVCEYSYNYYCPCNSWTIYTGMYVVPHVKYLHGSRNLHCAYDVILKYGTTEHPSCQLLLRTYPPPQWFLRLYKSLQMFLSYLKQLTVLLSLHR